MKMTKMYKTFINYIIIFCSLFSFGCLSQELCNITTSCKKSILADSIFPLLFVLSNSTSTSTSDSNLDTLPTIEYPSSNYILTINVSYTLTPLIGGTPLTNCSISPTLPANLSLNVSTCVISGSITSAQSVLPYTITASNSSGSKSTQINISAVASGSAPTISFSGSPFSFNQNATISSLNPTLTGNTPTSCNASPSLPTGISINNITCVISGTPTVTQSATNHTITATNGYGTGQTTINITVSAAGVAPTISYSGSPFIFTQNSIISNLSPTLTGNAPTSCSAIPALPSGLTINNTTCVISGTPTSTQTATNHSISASNGFGSGNTNINITVGAIPSLSYSGSPFTYTQNSAIATLTPSLSGNALSSCTASPTLPTGLSINNSTCVISGTPTITQSATNHTVTATNSFGNTTAVINISVNAPTNPPTLNYPGSPFTLPVGANPLPAWVVNLTGTPISSCVSTPSLPVGFNINNSTCQITGTASSSFTATNFSIRATNAYGFVDTVISITAPP